MADDRDEDAPSLEPPSLFGRKKKKPAPPSAATPPAAKPAPPVEAGLEEPPATPVIQAEPVAEPVPAPASPPVAKPLPEPTPVTDESPTTIFDEPAALPLDPPPAPATAPAPEAKAPRAPLVTGRLAAALAGLVVGMLIVGATAGSLQLCTKIKGTSSCGNSGLFLLLAILVVAVLVGAALLRAARVPEAGSTSFLAVGLLSVLALLFLVGQLFAWWMIIVIPIVSVVTFLVSHWVTSNYVDPNNDASDPDRVPEPHDVR